MHFHTGLYVLNPLISHYGNNWVLINTCKISTININNCYINMTLCFLVAGFHIVPKYEGETLGGTSVQVVTTVILHFIK